LTGEARSGTSGYRTTFVYDPAGNRLQRVQEDAVTTSTYDAANRLLFEESAAGRTTFTYDPAGNRIGQVTPELDITTYAYDAEGRVQVVWLPDGEVVSYTWAPVNKTGDERIIRRDDGTDLQKLLWDNQNVLRELDGSNLVQAEYTYEPEPFGKLVSDRRKEESSFYRFDGVGSTTGLTDDAGVVTDEYRYRAFGETLFHTGTTETPYQWIGQIGYRQDASTGQTNLRRRDYAPRNGTFTTPDPLGLASGDENFYRYVQNDPVNRTDPSGLSSIYTWYDKVYANTGYFRDTYVGDLRGAEVARDVGGVEYLVDLSTVRSFADSNWSTVQTWGAQEWSNWFIDNGRRRESDFAPQGPTFAGGSRPSIHERIYADQFAREEEERQQRILSEKLLAQATEEVLSGQVPIDRDLNAFVLMPDGSAREINRQMDPECAQTLQERNPGCHVFDPRTGEPIANGLEGATVTPEALKEMISRRYAQLLRESNTLPLSFYVDIAIGFMPIVSEFVDFVEVCRLVSQRQYTAAAAVAVGVAVPLVGGKFIGRFFSKSVSASMNVAVDAASEAGQAAARCGADAALQAKVLVRVDAPTGVRAVDALGQVDEVILERLRLGAHIEIPAGTQGIRKMMSDLSIVSGNEVALVRLQSGRRVLVMGGPNSVSLPPRTARIIAHTHPRGSLRFSLPDLRALNARGQRSSVIICPQEDIAVRIPVTPPGN